MTDTATVAKPKPSEKSTPAAATKPPSEWREVTEVEVKASTRDGTNSYRSSFLARDGQMTMRIHIPTGMIEVTTKRNGDVRMISPSNWKHAVLAK